MSEGVSYFAQLMLTGVVLGSIYALVALGFVLIYKATSILNFAQGELLMVGAYVCFSLTTGFHLPFIIAFLITVVFSFFFGLLLERVLLRKMIGESIISIIMLTIATSTVLLSLIQIIWGTNTMSFPQIFSDEPITFYGLFMAEIHLYSLGLALLSVIGFGIFFKFTSTGYPLDSSSHNM